MFLVDVSTGSITTIQGDSGTLNVENLPTDKNYTLYFNVYDENRRMVLTHEPSVATNGSDIVTLVIPAEMTDLLTVDEGEDSKTYYYGLKLCYEAEGTEDTLVIGDGDIWNFNEIVVLPKKVEGTI